MDIVSLYLSFHGRLGRSAYWAAMAGLLAAAALLWANGLLSSASLPVYLILLYPFLAVMAKRSRDTGWPAWLSVLVILPGLNLLWLLILGITPSRGAGFERGRFDRTAGARTRHAAQGPTNRGNESAAQSQQEKIVWCPSCERKMRIRLPAQAGIGRCGSCREPFRMEIDQYGQIFVYKATRNGKAESENARADRAAPDSISACLRVLDLGPEADKAAVRKRYRQKMKQCHPDKVASAAPEVRLKAEEESKRLNQAYAMLKKAGYV
ncbi:MAG: hypothetical protein CME36_01265 [unclassified Hahellaceae]|nr:hypothetical protein [Hahellaceae bacterium]|tara:strand:+ start:11890 stop:12687 length:798 start_codon:yes stop_codon:yes gene_type:complete